jgi:Secretory lipase
VWGYSQGGQAAMFSLDIGDSYAPELHLEGVVAGAPPSQFADLFSHLKTSKFSYYLLMLVVGLNAQYGDEAAPLEQILTPAGMALLPTLRGSCLTLPGFGFLQPVNKLLKHQLGNASISRTFSTDPFTITKWRRAISANDPKFLKTVTSAPLLIVQGGSDEQIPAVSSEALARQQCAIGQNVERWLYPDQNHAWALVLSVDDVTHWIADRFAGDAEPDRYLSKRIPHIGHTACPGEG